MPEFLGQGFAALATRQRVENDELVGRALEEFISWYEGPGRPGSWLPLNVPRPNDRVWIELEHSTIYKVDRIARAHRTKPYDIAYTAIKRYIDAHVEGVDTLDLGTRQRARLEVEPGFVARLERCIEAYPQVFTTKTEFYEQAARAWLTRRLDRLDVRYNHRRPPRLDEDHVNLGISLPALLERLVVAAADDDGVDKAVLFFNVVLDLIEACESGRGVTSRTGEAPGAPWRGDVDRE
jgi:predicted transcriptional regulator